MSSFLYALGRWSFHRWGTVLLIWTAVLGAGVAGTAVLSQGTSSTFSIPGTESQEALDRLGETFPAATGGSTQIVAVTDAGGIGDPDVAASIATLVEELQRLDQVDSVSTPLGEDGQLLETAQVSEDRSAVLISAQLSVGAQDVTTTTSDAIVTIAEEGSNGAVSYSTAPLIVEGIGLTPTEIIGVVVAAVVLTATLGSLLAAGMPLVTAIIGVAITMTGVLSATAFTDVSATAPLLAVMIGLAVGIDYGLFIVARYRALLTERLEPQEASARAVATAGSAVVFAGLTVMIALAGLAVANIPFLTVMGLSAAFAVLIAVLIALTLLPALMGGLGVRLIPTPRSTRRASRRRRLLHRQWRSPSTTGVTGAAAASAVSTTPGAGAGAGANAGAGGTGTGGTSVSPTSTARQETTAATARRGVAERWVGLVTRKPVVTLVLVVAGLLTVALPALDLRLALPDSGSARQGTATRDTYDLLSEKFGAGFNGPLIVTGDVIASTDPLTLVNDMAEEIRGLPGVAAVPLATPNEDGDTMIIQVVPEGGPSSVATADLVAELRELRGRFQREHGVTISVTGSTAVAVDVSAQLSSALVPFVVLVVGLSLVLLTMVFRSLWVPVKAAAGYLLSIAAALGATVAVYQWGWLEGSLHTVATGPVISFMPILLLGILFGLAMDYEVFLVSSMRENWVHHRDAHRAIHTGFTSSARIVVAAAVIMIAVFAVFVPEGDATLQPIAFGLAFGVLVDAFLIRMTLVPAVMALLGERAWYLPRRLDRILPGFDVEGEGLAHQVALRQWPHPEAGPGIYAQDVRVGEQEHLVLVGVEVHLEPGQLLIVDGPHRSHRSALALLFSGRLAPSGGRLKVAGLVLPQQAATVRKVVTLIRAVEEDDLAAAVRKALTPRRSRTPGSKRARQAPPARETLDTGVVLVVENLEHVPSAIIRHEVLDVIAAACARGGTTAVVTMDEETSTNWSALAAPHVVRWQHTSALSKTSARPMASTTSGATSDVSATAGAPPHLSASHESTQ